MQKVKNVFIGLMLALAMVAMVEGPALAGCTSWVNIFNGSTCVASTPDLLPGSRWCNGSPAPGPSEATLFTETNYNSGAGYCMIVPMSVNGTLFSNLQSFYWDGATHHIQSIWLGSKGNATAYDGINFLGQLRTLYAPPGQYYENDVMGHWGFWVSSLYLRANP